MQHQKMRTPYKKAATNLMAAAIFEKAVIADY